MSNSVIKHLKKKNMAFFSNMTEKKNVSGKYKF